MLTTAAASPDWSCPAIVDCVWKRLCSLPYLGDWRELGFKSPIYMWLSVTGVCRATWLPTRLLYERIGRPFLVDTYLCFAERVVTADMAMRRFTRDLARVVERSRSSRVSMSGEFACWLLDRELDVGDGGDGLPRARKGVTFEGYDNVSDLWAPDRIDVYLSDPHRASAAVSEEEIREATVRLFRGMWGEAGARLTCFSPSDRPFSDGSGVAYPSPLEEEGAEGEDRLLWRQREFARLAEKANVSERARELLLGMYKEALRGGTGDPPSMRRRLWSAFAPFSELMIPSCVTVWWCVDALDMSSTHFLSHQKVTVTTGEEDCAWVFRASERTLQDLRERRLRMDEDAVLASDLRDQVEDVVRSLRSGFSVQNHAA